MSEKSPSQLHFDARSTVKQIISTAPPDISKALLWDIMVLCKQLRDKITEEERSAEKEEAVSR